MLGEIFLETKAVKCAHKLFKKIMELPSLRNSKEEVEKMFHFFFLVLLLRLVAEEQVR